MPYLANIPLGNDQLNVSQGQILDNFQALSTYVSIDHVEFNLADQGKAQRCPDVSQHCFYQRYS